MMNSIGVMQGRLLPKYQGRYQAHPVDCWAEEFFIAKNLGLDCIEFILDLNDIEKNPLMHHQGVADLQSVIANTNVCVKTICADYLMEAPLHSDDEQVSRQSIVFMERLFQNAHVLSITDIVIPCVDQSSLRSENEKSKFIEVIRSMVNLAAEKEIRFSLETDLEPLAFLHLLEKIDSPFVTVNYDIGNSAALGFDPVVELDVYGDRISDIHIKDRIEGGGPVFLGEGNADFDRFFNRLSKLDYTGPFIMQAYRDEEGVDIFKQQLEWVRRYFN